MDVAGFLDLLSGLEDDSVEKHAIDTLEPSPFAHGILAAQPYSFLDDAPLEERRTQAVKTRRASDPRGADDPESLCALDVAAVERVRGEAWPDPQSAEEVHEALLWMGFVAEREVLGWRAFLDALAAAGRVVKSGDRWYATEAPRAGKEVLRGRLEALGPVLDGDPLLDEFAFEARELEAEGAVLRARFPVEGSSPLEQRLGWCIRRLLARIHRYTLDRLRKEIEPVTAAEFLRFLCAWQHVSPDTKLEGPRGVLDVVRQLAGFQAPAEAWERHILPARVNGYRRDWLDALAFSGEVAWGRLWGSGTGTAKSLPVALFAREDHDAWLALAEPVPTIALADAHEDDPANRMIRRGVGSTASRSRFDSVRQTPRTAFT
jgi:ATP-dependent Lhr-like helicase